MVIKRIFDHITKGRLLSPEELMKYRQNQQMAAYLLQEVYVQSILEKYLVDNDLDEETFEIVKKKLAALISSDISLLESESLEDVIQNIVLENNKNSLLLHYDNDNMKLIKNCYEIHSKEGESLARTEKEPSKSILFHISKKQTVI